MSLSAEWDVILAATRHPNSALRGSDIPKSAGVYAWFQGDQCMYVGKASNLRARLGKHRSASLDLSRSTLRASVAVLLLGVSRQLARQRPSAMTADQIATVSTWFATASVAWIECPDAGAADVLERKLRATWMPPLNLV